MGLKRLGWHGRDVHALGCFKQDTLLYDKLQDFDREDSQPTLHILPIPRRDNLIVPRFGLSGCSMNLLDPMASVNTTH